MSIDYKAVIKETIEKYQKEHGRNPTVIELYNITGFPRTTIFNYLDEVKKNSFKLALYAENPDVADIVSDKALAIVKELFKICKERADKLAVQALSALGDQEKDIQKELARLDDLEENYKLKKQRCDAEVNAAKAEIARLDKDNKFLKEQLERANKQLDQVSEQMARANETINNLSKLVGKAKEEGETAK